MPRRQRKPSAHRPTRPSRRAPEVVATGPVLAGAGAQRLQKVLAAGGYGSRRNCEELITQGRVEVDGQTVLELGTRVDPEAQTIKVDGERLKLGRRVYYAVFKPVGYVSTNQDPSGRPRVIDLVPPSKEHLFAVGRLDLSSEGLMIITNDGELAQRLAHPRFGIEKTYLAQVAGVPSHETLEKLRKGVRLAEGPARVVSVELRSEQKQSAWLEIVLAEGKNREVRRILAKIGHKVMNLRRIAIGTLRLKDMKPGEHRRLVPDEVAQLVRSPVRRPEAKRRPPRRTGRATPPREAASPAAQVDRPVELAPSEAQLAARHPRPRPATNRGDQRPRRPQPRRAGR